MTTVLPEVVQGALYPTLVGTGSAVAGRAVAGQVSAGVDQAVKTFTAPAQVAVSAWDTLTNPQTWLRVAYLVVGIGLVYVAVLKVEAGAITNSQAAQLVVAGGKKVATKGAAS